MKKTFYILLFLIFNLNSFSQIKTPFPDSTGAWIQTWGGTNGDEAFRLYVNGDTTINSIQYNILSIGNTDLNDTSAYYAGSNILGFYRIDSNKVYYFDNSSMTFSLPFFFSEYNDFYFSDTNEVMLYDFNAQVGDTILLSSTFTQEIVVTSIDSIQINGNYYTRWNFSGYSPPLPYQYYWIEGIGSTIGFFPYYYFFEDGVAFYCFHENSEDFIFYLGGATSCETVGIESLDKSLSTLNIYPNPLNADVNFSFTNQGNSNEAKLRVIGMDGKELWTKVFPIKSGQNQVVANLGFLPSGLYLIDFTGNDFHTRSKLVVE